MFLDEKTLHIEAGKGGDGVALFRREIYVPRGGPDGGDGGKGGDVVIRAKRNLHALTNLSHLDRVEAEDGLKGAHQRSTGHSGKDSTIDVPLGTIVEEKQSDGSWKQVFEALEEDDSLVLAKGGNGGWGNWHFKTSVQQAPERWNPGQEGEKKDIRLTLKLIADVGLVGLPNAGKSTFLSVVSAAKPKIADYPFTTLEPQLGVAEIQFGKEKKHIVIADLPGLIEGASAGKGLGSRFLKHVERTKTILHLIDGSMDMDQIAHSYEVIRKELEEWSPALAKKAETIVLTKTDLITTDEAAEKQSSLASLTKKPVYLISSLTRQGCTELLTKI